MPKSCLVWLSILFTAYVVPVHGETAKTVVCYGTAGARQQDCTEVLEGAIMPPPERAGQVIAVLEPGAIVLDVVGEAVIKDGIDRKRLVRIPFEAAIDDVEHA